MKEQKFLLMIWFSVIAFAFSSCAQKFNQSETPILIQAESTFSPTPPSSTDLDSAIRKIDFKNFSYPETNDYPTFKLKNGEKTFKMMKEDGLYLSNVEYFDLTNDGSEEAILNIPIQTGGSAMPNLIYIYTLKNNKPKVLWGFMTGDRAEGGLKKVYSDDGELVVETFGKSEFKNGIWKFGFPEKVNGYCCPTAYTRIRFKWNDKIFEPLGEPELFDYDWQKEMNRNS